MRGRRVRISRTDHAQGTGRRHHDQGLGLARSNGAVELLRQLHKEVSFRLVVPVGLLHSAFDVADRAVGAARRVAAERACRQVLLLQNLYGLEVGKFGIARVFENQSLRTIADNNPLAVTYQ